jgi:hypothetical protein
MSIVDKIRNNPRFAVGGGVLTGVTTTASDLPVTEPWSGYDEQDVDAITTALAARDADTARQVGSYERANKDRAGVLEAADHHTT